MESVEVSARTVDEAIDIALEELGLRRSQVTIEVLTPGKPGIFGLGGEPARVRVTALEEGTARPMVEEEMEAIEATAEGAVEITDIDAPEVELAVDYLRQLLEMAGIEAEVSVREPETPGDGLGRASAVLDVEGEDLGLLIGRRGSTLAAAQYLVNLMVNRKLQSRVLVTVDAEGYHRRREDSLHGLARRMADRVRQSRRPVTLEPMPAAERRIIHLALADDPAVMTSSVGVGDDRKVVIQPRRPNGRPIGR
ncbi:MAG TPA: RNA-binding cell elongation regulator Jag/EloR [Dehalococcoidia bacterium]|nr:RNA-binding cell elongation regulator Jag/EloR [Dehalococcoidia bacterium]